LHINYPPDFVQVVDVIATQHGNAMPCDIKLISNRNPLDINIQLNDKDMKKYFNLQPDTTRNASCLQQVSRSSNQTLN
jgi:hypothetical protein